MSSAPRWKADSLNGNAGRDSARLDGKLDRAASIERRLR